MNVGRALPLIGGLLLSIVVVIVGAAYVKFYNERTQNYHKHSYVLQYECQSGRQLPHIQYNRMTYDGTSTNCTEAMVFTSILPSIGAVHDMWIASPFYALLYANDWKIQAFYVLSAVAAIVTGIRSYFTYRQQQAVLHTFSESRGAIVKSAIDDRPRMLVKTASAPPRKDAMQVLAEQLLSDNEEITAAPVFTRLCHSLNDGAVRSRHGHIQSS